METENNPKHKWIPNPNYATATHEVDPKLPMQDDEHLEQTIEGVTMDEWYGGFSKIESTEPVIKDFLITDPVPEWRELGPDETICEGDECLDADDIWWKVSPIYFGCRTKEWKVRTRRPLPKQEEMPLEKELELLKDRDWSVDPIPSITNCLRYLRDEIQKLNARQDDHRKCLDLFCTQLQKLKQP
jgi:hypothetical protein